MTIRVLSVLAAAVLLSTSARAAAPPPPASLKADLDGDGKPESITLRWTPENPVFTLQVGSVSLPVKTASGQRFEAKVVDLDKGDKWKEIAVVATGELDFEHRVYFLGYDGKALKPLGDIHLPQLDKLAGNGIVLADTWRGFWNQRDKYQLDRAQWKLREVPQEFYFVGAEGTVKQSFPIAFDRTARAAPVAQLAQGSRIQVLLAAPPSPLGQPTHYLVKSTTGLLGWTTHAELEQKTEGLPFAG